MPLSPPTLKQLAARIVVLEELPTDGLPPKMEKDMEALTLLPGSYVVTKSKSEVVRLDGKKLTPAELRKAGNFIKKVCAKLSNVRH